MIRILCFAFLLTTAAIVALAAFASTAECKPGFKAHDTSYCRY